MGPRPILLRRLLLLVGLLSLAAGAVIHAHASVHAAMVMAGDEAPAAHPPGDCDGCPDDGMSASGCKAVCGFSAVTADFTLPPPARAGRGDLPAETRPPGRRGPPEPHPPRTFLPV